MSAPDSRERWRRILVSGAELLILLCWTLVVVRPYLNMDPTLIPSGREYGSAIQSHSSGYASGVWRLRPMERQCTRRTSGPGRPVWQFPASLVAVTMLGWGVINGSKVALAGAFSMAGRVQWWLAPNSVRLGGADVDRHAGRCCWYFGRADGDRCVWIVLSTAACSLVFPALLRVNRLGTTRSIVILGITLALALVAGQGYMQFGLAFVLLAALLLLPWDRTHAIAPSVVMD